VWESDDPRLLAASHAWYWNSFIRLDIGSGGQPVVWLVVAVAAIAGVAAPSLIRAARAARTGTPGPESD
jgi:hypothetical protein